MFKKLKKLFSRKDKKATKKCKNGKCELKEEAAKEEK